ncbi:MAG: class I SAM-dependent methyltransferase [Gemmatimonadetes bacterium]|nr:class I SAM-dependent methyltransferase [Gemmatimonadota bacterium]
MVSRTERVRAYFRNPDTYLSDNHNIASRAVLVREMLGDIRSQRILDLGCGDGTLSLQFVLQNNQVTMVDLSQAMLDRARSRTPEHLRSRVRYVYSDLLELPLEDPYDIVLCIGVLAHVGSVDQTIDKISRLLRAGGRCILQITDSSRSLTRLIHSYYSLRERLRSRVGYSLNRMTVDETLAVAARHSLRLVSVRRHALLFPGMGRLPSHWLLEYDLFVMSHPLLSRYGSSALLLLEKRH